MKRCPVCQRRYSEAKQFCTRDGTPLSESGLSEASRVVNHCKLCNKFYPQADGICPIHGIPIAEELFEPEQNAPQTREIEKTQKTLITSMSILGFNSDDRRLVTTLATLTVLLLLSLGIYSLTRPAKSEHSGSYEDLTSSNTPSPEEGDRQLIELAGNPSAGVGPDTPSLTNTSKQKPSGTAQAQSSEESVSKTTNNTASHTNGNTARSKNQATTETRSTPTAPSQTAPPPTVSSAQGASVTDRSAEIATPSPKPSYSRATTSHPRVQITGKARREIENGYVYEFDLVINGATGIKWHSVSGSKVTYGGRSTPIKTAQLEPTRDGSLRYHVSVRMTGPSVEDWYGQVYTTTIGTDEEGRTVRIEQDIFLDDSFPVIRQVTRY